MEAVAPVYQSALGRDPVTVFHDLRDLANQMVMGRAATGIGQFAGDKGHIRCGQPQILAQVGDKFIDATGPGALTGIAFALVEDDAFDHPGFLRLAGQIQDPPVTAGAIIRRSADGSVGRFAGAIAGAVLQEIFDGGTAIGAAHQANSDIGAHRIGHGFAKGVPRAQAELL